ncbi:MAG: amidase [Acidobacteria bacterium]|nr:amidase [Acidobacteriota bacterium]
MIKRRDFMQSCLAGGTAFFSTNIDSSSFVMRLVDSGSADFELTEATIAQLQDGMKQGRFTARSIAEMYLGRIAGIDKQGPKINSIIELNPDALSIADKLDEERKAKGPRGPMHGIPVLLKDNIDTADRMMTTAGSLALEGSYALQDAFIARRLREAGAVILGKTNLSEWANFRSTHSTSGWSGRGGLTRNPYSLDRNPCGSSSGSGASIASNLCAVAIGTETDGSVVCPASTTGIVGIKPTVGLVSRAGIIPIAHSQDTAGPMARTVSDAAILLSALTGIDPRDAATQKSRGRIQTDYTRFLDPNGLKGMRIGIARKYFGYSDKVDKLIDDAIDVLKRSGAIIIDPVGLEAPKAYEATELEVLLYEFKADLNKYLAGLAPNIRVRSMKDVIEFNEKNRQREMPFFGQELMIQSQAKGPLSSPAYRKALQNNLLKSRTEGIDAVVIKHRLDAIVAPTGGPAWTTDLINGDHFTGSSSTPAAVAGYPAITVPAGFINGLPIGISFFGAAWTEPKLIKAAYAYEQATKHRRPPEFPDRIE